MNTTPRPQSRNQAQNVPAYAQYAAQNAPYPNGAYYSSSAGQRPAYPFLQEGRPGKQSWWEKEGVIGKIFAGAGVFVTLIGVVMLLVIAARAGLLRPELRVGGGALLSAVLLAASTRLEQRLGGRVGAIALAATGTAGLFLCVVAATNLYGWIPPAAGLTIAAVIAATAVALAMKWNSQALAVLMTSAVGVLAVFLTEGLNITLVAFLVLLQAAGCVPEFTKEWPAIAAARTLPVTVAATAAISLDRVDTGAQLAAYLVATIALASALAASRRRSEGLTAVMYGLASIPMIIAVTALTAPVAAVAGVAIASMTLVAIVVARPVGAGTCAAATVVTAASLLAGAVTITVGVWLPAVLLAIALVFAASTYPVKNHYAAALAVCFAGIGHVAFFAMGWSESEIVNHADAFFVSGLLMMACEVLIALVGIRRYGADTEGAVALLSMALLVSTATTNAGLFAMVLVDGRPVAHLATTVTWMLLAVGLLAASLKAQKSAKACASMGLIVAALALGKLFLHDLASLDGIVRAGAFIVVGLVLLGAGTGYAQAFAKRAAARRAAQQATAPVPTPMH